MGLFTFQHYVPCVAKKWHPFLLTITKSNVNRFLRATAYIAIARICYHPSVCLSVTWVVQSKEVEARITKFSPYISAIPLVFPEQVHPEILRGSPRAGALNEGG